jgi:lipid-binding SYLF domain-containing protein
VLIVLGVEGGNGALLVRHDRMGSWSLLKNTIKLGTDESAAIGPEGWDIEGVSSRSIGMDFVTYALSIERASIGARDNLNKAYHGSAVRPSDIVARNVKPNPNSQVLRQEQSSRSVGCDL